MLAKFACANLAAKFSVVHSLDFGVVIYLLWPGILFSRAVGAVRAVVVAKLVILDILFLPSFILALRAVVVKSIILGISFLTPFILAL